MDLAQVHFMLAKKGKAERVEELFKSSEWAAQEKFDGTRFQLFNGVLRSRKTSVFTNDYVDRTANVPHLLQTLKSHLGTLDGTIFDGEVVHSRGFGQCRSAMGSGPERAIEWQKKNGKVIYKIFDCIMYKGKEVWKQPYHERHKGLRKLFTHVEGPALPYIKVPALAYSEREKRELYAKVIARGGEGIILKNLLAQYVFDRSKEWIKVKKTQTYDAVIVGYDDPKEWYAAPGETGADGKLYPEGRHTKFFLNKWIGAIKFGLYDAKKKQFVEVGQCSGVNEEVRKEISDNKKKFIGQVIEFTAQERMPTGGFRHPQFLRFRDDKNPQDCVEWT